MICPQCRGEYREGFEICSDCGVPLIPGQADVAGELGDDNPSELVPLWETHDPDELAALVEGLEHANIAYVVQAGTALSVLDGSSFREAGFPDHWHARVSVVAAGAEQAMELLKPLRESLKSDRPWVQKPELMGPT